MSKRALIICYPQNEENEVVTPMTVLKRGGVECIMAGPTSEPVVGSNGIRIVPDMSLRDAMKKGPYDVVVTAGGKNGWMALSEDADVGKIWREQEKSGRLLAAICTSPIAMRMHGIMYGRRLTSYPHPNVESSVREGDHYIYKYDDVVVDRNLITSRGHRTTFDWSIKILEWVTDPETARRVAQEMLLHYFHV